MKESKLQFLATALVLCVFAFLGQSTRPMLADGAIVPQHVSYSPMDAIALPSGSMARTKRSEWLVILWVANARTIPTAVLDSVGQAE